MKDIAIIGAGGFGREVHMLIDRINIEQKIYNIIGYYDDDLGLPSSINGKPFLGNIDELKRNTAELYLVIAVGSPEIKMQIYSQLMNFNNFKFSTLIDPSVIIDLNSSEVGMGVIICSNSIVTVNVQIHEFVTINLNCTIGHDSLIKSFASLMPSVNVSGEVTVEKGVYIGTGATIINQLSIGQNTVVGAGAVVTKQLPANCTAVGAPAKPIKYHS